MVHRTSIFRTLVMALYFVQPCKIMQAKQGYYDFGPDLGEVEGKVKQVVWGLPCVMRENRDFYCSDRRVLCCGRVDLRDVGCITASQPLSTIQMLVAPPPPPVVTIRNLSSRCHIVSPGAESPLVENN